MKHNSLITKGIVLLIGLFLSFSAIPAERQSVLGSGAIITLTDKPCSSQILKKMITPESLKGSFDGSVQWEGKTIKLCWKVHEGKIAVIDETGDGGELPLDIITKPIDRRM